jgi:hypothetical protein
MPAKTFASVVAVSDLANNLGGVSNQGNVQAAQCASGRERISTFSVSALFEGSMEGAERTDQVDFPFSICENALGKAK